MWGRGDNMVGMGDIDRGGLKAEIRRSSEEI